MSPPRHPEAAVDLPNELQKTLARGKSPEGHGVVASEEDLLKFDDEHKPLSSKPPANIADSKDDTAAAVGSQENAPAESSSILDAPNSADDETLPIKSTETSSPTHNDMESSIVTLRSLPLQAAEEPLVAAEHSNVQPQAEPTTKKLRPSHSISITTPNATLSPQGRASHDVGERSPTRSDAGFDEKPTASEDEREPDSRSEIQSIMDQFSEEGGGPGVEEVMSPRLEIAGPLLGNPVQHPPRKSSLEPLRPSLTSALEGVENLNLTSPTSNYQTRSTLEKGPAVPPKPGSIHSLSPIKSHDGRRPSADMSMSPALHRPPPPEPEPEPDLPFDFHRFLEQLRHRTADPVAKFLRSFLLEFGKKQWMVHEQVKIISDFLLFITNKMAQCDVWREVSDAEFDNAREGMEKLVMNRLYTQTFSPAIPIPQPIPGSRPRRKNGERPLGPGRRGQHQEDVERDDILAQKVGIYGWVKEEHLDIPPVGDSGKRFLVLAQQELLKIKTYRAPRDKIICVLNCCKVIFGLLKHSKADSSADSFMPLLIYTVLQSNPDHLVSNVQYILRFRNQDKLGGEAGYYLSSLMGAIQFIENLDRTTLTITDEDFEKHVEAAVFAIAEKHKGEEADSATREQFSENSGAAGRPVDGEPPSPRKSTSSYDTDGDGSDEKAAMSGLFRAVQRPLTTIGRMFSEEGPSVSSGPARTPLPGNTPRLSPAPRDLSPRHESDENVRQNRMEAEDAAARQASAEAAEAHREQRAQHANVVETLANMFPDLDREIISDVVTQKEGRVGLAVDACLALSQ